MLIILPAPIKSLASKNIKKKNKFGTANMFVYILKSGMEQHTSYKYNGFSYSSITNDDKLQSMSENKLHFIM